MIDITTGLTSLKIDVVTLLLLVIYINRSIGTGIGLLENPTSVVPLQFIDQIGNILQTFAKTFNRLTLPGQNEGNYRVFTLLAAAPGGAIVIIVTIADSEATPGIVVDDFS